MQVAETTALLTGVRLLEPSTLGGFFFFGGGLKSDCKILLIKTAFQLSMPFSETHILSFGLLF